MKKFKLNDVITDGTNCFKLFEQGEIDIFNSPDINIHFRKATKREIKIHNVKILKEVLKLSRKYIFTKKTN